MNTDTELINEILNGSHAAMELLVKRHYKTVYSFIYRKTGNYHLACDLTQETFIKVLRSINKYENRHKFPNWLLKIAINTCIDYSRLNISKTAQNIDDHKDIQDSGTNVIELVTLTNDREMIKEAILQLPDHQRDVVLLKFFHGMPTKDICKVTQSKQSTVKSRLRLGLLKLKELLKGADIHEKKNA